MRKYHGQAFQRRLSRTPRCVEINMPVVEANELQLALASAVKSGNPTVSIMTGRAKRKPNGLQRITVTSR